MTEQEIQSNETEGTCCKSGKGKKIAGGCGCGCLIVILLLVGLFYWGYSYIRGIVTEFEEQGYTLVEGQEINKANNQAGPIVYFGQQVTISGDVDGNVAAICQVLLIEGTIHGDLDLFCQEVTIAESAVITGNVRAKLVQQLTVLGDVQGEITGEMDQLIQPEPTPSE